MAWLIGDSFDFYASINDLAAGHWDSVGASSHVGLSSTTRFSVGQSLVGGSSANTSTTAVTRALGSNEATLFVALAFRQNTALSGTNQGLTLTFRDGSTAQCSIVFQSNGDILLKSAITGSTLASYSNAFAQNVWAHFQFKIVINNTTGSISVRKDGAGSDSFAATSLNTRGGTSNNYANSLALYFGTSSNTLVQYCDDLLCYSSFGAAPNDWVGDVRAVVLMANADTAQKQFAIAPATLTDGVNAPGVLTATMTANVIFYNHEFVAAQTGTVGSLTLNFNAGITGNVKVAIYNVDPANTDTPTTLVGTASNAVTNPTTGLNTFTFGSPPTITAGNKYLVAILQDTTWTSANASNGTVNMLKESMTYASGFPSTATPAVNSNVRYQHSLLTVTLTVNAQAVDEALEDGDTTYVYDSTSGHEDLYDLTNLSATPTTIIAVQSRMFAKKSDSGTRNGQIRVKSGATEVGGTDTVLGTSYTWLNKVDTVDPNTSSAWTASAVNALQVGPKVTA